MASRDLGDKRAWRARARPGPSRGRSLPRFVELQPPGQCTSFGWSAREQLAARAGRRPGPNALPGGAARRPPRIGDWRSRRLVPASDRRRQQGVPRRPSVETSLETSSARGFGLAVGTQDPWRRTDHARARRRRTSEPTWTPGSASGSSDTPTSSSCQLQLTRAARLLGRLTRLDRGAAACRRPERRCTRSSAELPQPSGPHAPHAGGSSRHGAVCRAIASGSRAAHALLRVREPPDRRAGGHPRHRVRLLHRPPTRRARPPRRSAGRP